MGIPEGKRSLESPRRRWEDNIKMDLTEVGCDPGDWIDLAEDRAIPSLCKGGNEPPGSLKGNYREFLLLRRMVLILSRGSGVR